VNKTIAVRVDDKMIQAVEGVRDQERYPTQSDFVREAIRRMIREERKKRVAAEIKELMRNEADVRLAQAFAEENFAEMVEGIARIEREYHESQEHA
jgi:Arc/MetJ-type ribon-helix-helix transcriptional regulator